MFFHFDVQLKDFLYLLGVVVAAAIGALTVWRTNIRQVRASLNSTKMLIEEQRSERLWRANREEFSQWSADFRLAFVGCTSKIDELLNAFQSLRVHSAAFNSAKNPVSENRMEQVFEVARVTTLKYLECLNDVKSFYQSDAPEYKDFSELVSKMNSIVTDYNADTKDLTMTAEERRKIDVASINKWKGVREDLYLEFTKIIQRRREQVHVVG